MKKIFQVIPFILFLSLVWSCDSYDDRYPAEYASVVRLAVYGEHDLSISKSSQQTDFEISVLRSGYDINRDALAKVTVMSDAEWTKYANTYGVQRYYVIPDDCYSLGESGSEAVYTFSAAQLAANSCITFNIQKLQDFYNSLPPPISADKEWANVICLPLSLTAVIGSACEDQRILILKPVM